MTPITKNAQTINQELTWFEEVLHTRLNTYLNVNAEQKSIYDIPPPELNKEDSYYGGLVSYYSMSFAERIALILALIPHVRPNLLDILFTKNESLNRGYTEFGGIHGNFHSGFIPTGETLAFILSGNNLEERLNLLKLFNPEHFFFRHGILKMEKGQTNIDEPLLSSVLKISDEYLSLLTMGEAYRPEYSTQFPAKRIETKLNWEDLVLTDHVREELEDIITWIRHGNTLMNDWGLEKRVKQGYRAMFYGPPGTGKTLTACLIGKALGIDTYRIDLSMIVSKFIGETEKNLANVFDQAENKNWILFFDEADALFGKRTNTTSSNDRHANQEVAYLLQRIEDFAGITILASNLKGNLDDAFARRFQSMIYFPIPDREQRLLLWEKGFNGKLQIDDKIDWLKIADEYEITGGSITNVLRHCSIKAIQRDSKKVFMKDIVSGIKKEHQKEGKA
ncbi:ATP-binding protein [Roseivirga pacifica]